MVRPFIWMFIFLGFSFQSIAQDSLALVEGDTIQSVRTKVSPTKKIDILWKKITGRSKPPQKGKLYAFPIPLLSASPTVGFLYGIGAGGSCYFDDPHDTRISTAQIGAAYTVKKQVYTNVKSAVYLNHDNWILYGDWRFLISSVPDFALGSGPETDKLASNGAAYNDNPYAKQAANVHLLYYDYLRVYETVLRRVVDKFYMGLAYHIDYYTKMQDDELNLNVSEPVTSNYYNYNAEHGFKQSGSILSGVSANAIYDTRDNQNNPYKGRYAYVSFRYNPVFLGSDKNSSTIWLEYRNYADIKHNHYNILAFWAYGNFVTSGAVPFLDLPSCGSDQFGRSGEAYINGRFKGEGFLFGEVEYRRHLFGVKNFPDLLGLALFVNMNTAYSKDVNVKLFQYVDPAIGGGLRISISRVARSNLCIDYAVGYYGSQGLYVRFNEAF